MVRTSGGHSLAANTFEELRFEILAGRYAAGERLLPTELAERYGVSTGVIREALIRLSEKGLTDISPNRGFSVVRAGADRVRDAIEVRIINETAALRLGIARGDLEWETSVVAAHHRLASVGEPGGDDVDRWFEAHLAYHEALISGSGNEMLTGLCSELLRIGELYVRWSVIGEGTGRSWTALETRDHAAEHAAILAAVIDRDSDLAATHYETHLRLTGALLLPGELEPLGDASAPAIA